jgi:hypothetical protein
MITNAHVEEKEELPTDSHSSQDKHNCDGSCEECIIAMFGFVSVLLIDLVANHVQKMVMF